MLLILSLKRMISLYTQETNDPPVVGSELLIGLQGIINNK
jgi:hypothetical protein